jgi:hypothetical protein
VLNKQLHEGGLPDGSITRTGTANIIAKHLHTQANPEDQ